MMSIDYEEQKYLLQVELRKWQQHVNEQGTKNIIIFEGRDGAGKSSCIKTITEHLNPRTSRIVALPKPTEEERSEWYWTRYIKQFPRDGEICFFDRSYYNRCGVERVFGWATERQVSDFYRECPQLEKMWVKSGINITKFYFSVSREEQARRFLARQTDPLKLGKMSEVDQLSQNKWDEYTKCKNQMMALTNLKVSPWITVKSDDKPQAKLNVMRYILTKNDYPNRDWTNIGHVDQGIIKI
jgi:polyphosphate kinase